MASYEPLGKWSGRDLYFVVSCIYLSWGLWTGHTKGANINFSKAENFYQPCFWLCTLKNSAKSMIIGLHNIQDTFYKFKMYVREHFSTSQFHLGFNLATLSVELAPSQSLLQLAKNTVNNHTTSIPHHSHIRQALKVGTWRYCSPIAGMLSISQIPYGIAEILQMIFNSLMKLRALSLPEWIVAKY